MKNIILLTILFQVCFSAVMGAQSTASVIASATIVTAVQMVKNSDIDFGNFTTNGGAGTVVLGADNTGAGTRSSNISKPNATGTVKAAGFTMTGKDNSTYSIIMPSSGVLIYNGTEKMVVDSFTCSASKVLGGGKEIIYLGATAHVNANQAFGTYSSVGSGMEVSVNYN
jgi:hypothetical protein